MRSAVLGQERGPGEDALAVVGVEVSGQLTHRLAVVGQHGVDAVVAAVDGHHRPAEVDEARHRLPRKAGAQDQDAVGPSGTRGRQAREAVHGIVVHRDVQKVVSGGAEAAGNSVHDA